MTKFKTISRFAVLLLTLSSLAAYAQITPSGDAYTNTALPTTNFGAKTLLDVQSASQTTYIQFDLSSLPSSYTSANITKATLKLYVNAVTTVGSFNVDLVNGTWAESKITADNAPALGSTIAASVPLTNANKNDYIIIDITSAVGEWLNGTQPNDGIALVGNSPLNATFDSKENTTTSHPPELDIVFAGGGTITGVTTASGSGLTGGGTSGTLNLSLTNTCAANQVLQWNGTSWECASVGTGTITGVFGGTDLTGQGTSGNVTLNLDTTKVPQLSTANTFASQQAISSGDLVLGNGNIDLPQTGSRVQGVITMGGLPLIHTCCSASAENTYVGLSAGAFNTGGSFNTAEGYSALTSNSTGYINTAIGANALFYNSSGVGNTATGAGALLHNTTGSSNTALGSSAGSSATSGSKNTYLGAATNSGQTNVDNATAIGANAQVTASNALVLGSINGVNGATANTLVGVGTTAPTYKLHVGTINNGFRVEGPPTPGGVAASFGGYGDFGIDGSGAPQGRLVVKDSTGFVGIGTATPAHTLEIVAGGTTLADGWGIRSSRRWKTNIRTLQGALAKVEQLRGVSYDRKESGKHEVGVIAEEVGTVVPEIVSWDKNGTDAQGVDYSRLTALLIEATKEQQLLIRKQQQQIETQQMQMMAQQSRIAHLALQVATIQTSLKARHAPSSEVQRVNAQPSTMRQ